ncbi:MAG TPA: SAM-dependent methyltransferase [Thermoplasmata archaeon]|nr:SAM-dependent methyltransferase [Thermoplasmata archaeon]
MNRDARRGGARTPDRSEGIHTVPAAMRAALTARANGAGIVGFDTFVEIALYTPGVGYYARETTTIGPQGDFYTAPQVHPIFGAVVAQHVLAEFERLGRPSGFTFAELGPGDGTLSGTVLEAIGEDRRADGWSVRLIDRSVPLGDAAFRRVRAAAFPGRFDVRSMGSIAEGGPFVGVVLANELLDAQPFRRFVRRAGEWREIGVRLRGDSLEPTESELLAPIAGGPLPDRAPDGTVFELSEIAEAVLREVADNLLAGGAVFFDYGATEDELVRGRPRGTATAVRAHRVVDDLTADAGQVDLSSFVNFTRMEDASARAGFEIVRSEVQRNALAAWGFEGVLDAMRGRTTSTEERLRLDLAAKRILFDFESFRCLELRPPRSAGPPPRGPAVPAATGPN